jgi:L-2-hydroxyglutarate oxidase LhgO
METANIVVIGAGVVGLSIAARLSENNEGIYVLEKNSRTGQEISGHNSGVIHSGIHYPKGTLKARLCVKGNSMLYNLGEKFDIQYKRLGKLTVASGENEIKEIENLYRMGNDNGVEGMKLLNSEEIREMEPNIVAEMALYTPSTGIIEPDDLMHHFYAQISNNGAFVSTQTEVTGIRETNSGYEVSGISSGEKFAFNASTVINSAGLFSDKVAAMAGMDVNELGYSLSYYKGDYFRIAGTPPVKMLVYPVPKGEGLGIHLTPDMAGSVKMGPNAYHVEKIDYTVGSSAEEFRQDVKRFLPSISGRDILEDSSGIRPKLQSVNGSFRDFVIRHEAENGYHGLINLIGIDSPGLTASPAIAEYVSELYENEVKH